MDDMEILRDAVSAFDASIRNLYHEDEAVRTDAALDAGDLLRAAKQVVLSA